MRQSKPTSDRKEAQAENVTYFVQQAHVPTWQTKDNCSFLPFRGSGKASPPTNFHV